MDTNALSPSTLAFVGDAYFGLLVRERLAQVNRPLGVLHTQSVRLVNAGAQSRAYKLIEPSLSEKEIAIYKRGRNAHVNSIPKNATVGEYHSATGLETLFGYLYLSGETDRARLLFDQIWESFQDTL